MQLMMPPELCLARTVSAPVGRSGHTFVPWVEVGARVHIDVPVWGFEEETWVHWAVPFRGGIPDLEAAARFDPGRRAAVPGEPPEALRLGGAPLDGREAERLCGALFERWRPSLAYHTALRAASLLDEPVEDFRRRCERLIREVAAQAPASAIESRSLEPDEITVLTLRAGIAWYPEGIGPASPGTDALPRAERRGGR